MSSKKLTVVHEDKFNHQIHTYTPRSHEELLKKISRNTIKNEEVKDIKRENEYLKSELNNTRKQLKKLQRKFLILENNKNKKGGTNALLPSVPESRSSIVSEIEIDVDDDYVKSWEVLGNHFSEVIRRHHAVLAEKDRQIRELQEKQYSRDLSNTLLDYSSRENTQRSKETPATTGKVKIKTEYDDSIGTQGRFDAGPSRDHQQCEDHCDCSTVAIHGVDHLGDSGETLSEHFSEVIRRHRQQLYDKDQQIRELEDALEHCLGRKPPRKRGEDSEVQMWQHDYHEQSQPSGRPQHHDQRLESTTKNYGPVAIRRKPGYSEEEPTTSSGEDVEDGDSLFDSTDTFVAIEKCQRLESICNLERLRQNLIQRLEMEEKLDKLYWQTELSRYRTLKEEAGDNFDPESSFNKGFEMLETTRLELLRALKDVKDAAKREPEIYVKPHLPFQDGGSRNDVAKTPDNFPETESKRRVHFTEQITVTTVQTTYDS